MNVFYYHWSYSDYFYSCPSCYCLIHKNNMQSKAEQKQQEEEQQQLEIERN